MEYVKIALKKAEMAKSLIMRLGLFDHSRAVQHSHSYVYFPILIGTAKAKKLLDEHGASIVSRRGIKKMDNKPYQQRLMDILTMDERLKLSGGYDQLGEIAIIELEGSRGKEKQIANALMKTNRSIKTVLAKAGPVSGEYRVRRLRYIEGRMNFITDYRENNCIFRFDVRRVFFSNRLSYERSRILKLVKDEENVMVMFAGVGPFAIEIAKTKPKAAVVAIELNRFGYKYMLDNIKLNKTPNVKPVMGDVKKLSGKYKNFADRIIMPLPKSSMEFLDDAYKIAKRRTVVHLYAFAKNANSIKDKIKEHAKKRDYMVRFLGWRIARPYSSTESEFSIDYEINKRAKKQGTQPKPL